MPSAVLRQGVHDRARRRFAGFAAASAGFALLGTLFLPDWWWAFLAAALVAPLPLLPQARAGRRAHRDVGESHRLAALFSPLEREGYHVTHGMDTVFGWAERVVVGPSGTYLVETTPWKGSKRRVQDDLEGVARRAADIGRTLQRAGIPCPVTPLMIATRGSLPGGPVHAGGVTVIEPEGLGPAILRPAKRLSEDEVTRALATLLSAALPVEARKIR